MMSVAALAAMVSIVFGCSDRAPDMPELGQVHGTVKLDGKPLSGVSILFEPEKGRTSRAKSNTEGVYEASYLIDETGVKLGPCSVRVEWGIDESGPVIPAKYGSKSELKLDVKPGDNTFDIEMKSK
ncbi:carboxypeptidase regulatory-like domain-containing protein [Gimesia fumaroli]|nr:carboxypeptidase regulatory-like domain-containing protein [Gimesia fumaroli]